jgi:hypothetical protein
MLFRALRDNELMRISIHPPDITHPHIWRQALRLAGRAAGEREAMGYRDFVSRWDA